LMQERVEGKDDVPGNHNQSIQDPVLREKVLHGTIPSKPDFLSRFLTLHEEQPDVVTDRVLLAYLFANINAGSDTIGSTLRAVFYYLLKNHSSYSELLSELREAQKRGKLSIPLPTWTECQALPYLNAVIKEALRLNPALALPMERIVPSTGLQIGDVFLAPGTVVGINPYVLHRNRRIFGQDAEEWRPGRWLDADVERVKYMDQHLLSFGAGKRTCLGRSIAMLELLKVVPTLLVRYEMELAWPEKEWKVYNAWVLRQEGLEMKLRRRDE
ncbi:hypothetical protein KC318_g10704, partial [Hortaea werneckii]